MDCFVPRNDRGDCFVPRNDRVDCFPSMGSGQAVPRNDNEKEKFIYMKKIIVVFCALILILGLRGEYGNPTMRDLNSSQWIDNGPFELSPERGRFALVYSLIEDQSLDFSGEVAKFAIPDVGYLRGKYVSLFNPGVSFLTIPGYLIGREFGLSQVGTFAIIPIFAILNVLLIRAIAIHFGARNLIDTLAGIVFLFLTPGF